MAANANNNFSALVIELNSSPRALRFPAILRPSEVHDSWISGVLHFAFRAESYTHEPRDRLHNLELDPSIMDKHGIASMKVTIWTRCVEGCQDTDAAFHLTNLNQR